MTWTFKHNTITENPCDMVNKWKSFDKIVFHCIHLNINILLDKIDQLRFIAEKGESKVDESVTETDFDIDGYTTIRNDRTRHGEDMVLYINEGIF